VSFLAKLNKDPPVLAGGKLKSDGTCLFYTSVFFSSNKLLFSIKVLLTGGFKNESILSFDVSAVLTSVDPTNSLLNLITGLSSGKLLILFYSNKFGF
jgi:hypothetical protein